ncbi:DUF6212 domain-containing protein [Eilatimonas milleporae]|uniref:Uncharacterized protein n=1 Tax=Eilatimonas milleporae TaxID=911205 RepID=A0A3M0BY96_9PROT|nr:DUF6212 domain-containing protein [Eilatimonas milleporae]RMB01417.1 hypothetical protein BXY39_3601 [Eilatimonas milleporae]
MTDPRMTASLTAFNILFSKPDVAIVSRSILRACPWLSACAETILCLSEDEFLTDWQGAESDDGGKILPVPVDILPVGLAFFIVDEERQNLLTAWRTRYDTISQGNPPGFFMYRTGDDAELMAKILSIRGKAAQRWHARASELEAQTFALRREIEVADLARYRARRALAALTGLDGYLATALPPGKKVVMPDRGDTGWTFRQILPTRGLGLQRLEIYYAGKTNAANDSDSCHLDYRLLDATDETPLMEGGVHIDSKSRGWTALNTAPFAGSHAAAWDCDVILAIKWRGGAMPRIALAKATPTEFGTRNGKISLALRIIKGLGGEYLPTPNTQAMGPLTPPVLVQPLDIMGASSPIHTIPVKTVQDVAEKTFGTPVIAVNPKMDAMTIRPVQGRLTGVAIPVSHLGGAGLFAVDIKTENTGVPLALVAALVPATPDERTAALQSLETQVAAWPSEAGIQDDTEMRFGIWRMQSTTETRLILPGHGLGAGVYSLFLGAFTERAVTPPATAWRSLRYLVPETDEKDVQDR